MKNRTKTVGNHFMVHKFFSKLSKHGLFESISIFVSLLVRYLLMKRSDHDFMRIAGIRREVLGRRIYEESSGKVLYGYFKNLKIVSYRWGARDLGSIILGEYERNIVEYINKVESNYTIFVDVGAADGLYAVGLLHNRKMKKSICFESSADGRASIELNAKANRVQQSISIRKTATGQFARDLSDEFGDELQNCLILIDIEGGEFDLLTSENLQILRNSVVIVELHKEAGDYESKLSKLYLNAKKFHEIRMLHRTGANPFEFKELESWPDEDRQIIFSEGRRYSMTWVALHPRF